MINVGASGTIMDTSAIPGLTYSYRLAAVNLDGISTGGPAGPAIALPAVDVGNQDWGQRPNNPGSLSQGVEAHFYNDQFWGAPNQRNASSNSINDIMAY